MQSTMSFAQTPVVSQRLSARPSRSALVVRATAEDSSRRAAVGAVLAGAVALFASNPAEAKIKNPAQDSLKKGGSSTAASMSAFDMEGIKKRGLKPGERKNVLAEAKAKALELADKANPTK